MCFIEGHDYVLVTNVDILLCLPGSVSTDILTNATAKTSWISKQLQLVKDYYLDGVNFDYEDAILQTQPGLRNGYRDLVARTTAAFKSYDPSLMVFLL